MFTEIGEKMETEFEDFYFWTSKGLCSDENHEQKFTRKNYGKFFVHFPTFFSDVPGRRFIPSILRKSEYLSKKQVVDLLIKEKEKNGEKNIEKNEKKYKIFLMTHWRYWGLRFNPISYYHCWCEKKSHEEKNEGDVKKDPIIISSNDSQSDSVNNEFQEKYDFVAVVDEVTNTPWNETVHYVSLVNSKKMEKGKYVASFPKKMHVSPFLEMDYIYTAKFTEPWNSFAVDWTLSRNSKVEFSVNMDLGFLPVNQMTLIWIMVSFPVMTWKVMGAIYWQAVKLKLKGATHFFHPKYLKKDQ